MVVLTAWLGILRLHVLQPHLADEVFFNRSRKSCIFLEVVFVVFCVQLSEQEVSGLHRSGTSYLLVFRMRVGQGLAFR